MKHRMRIPDELLNYPELSDWCILNAYRGSVAHDMYIPNSDPNSVDDIDIMAVCVPPVDYYIGLNSYGSRGTREIKYNEWDVVVYEATKLIRLLSKGNPNVLSILWVDPKEYITKRYSGEILLSHRDVFSCKHVYHSFTGYAYSQLHRMTHYVFEGYMGSKRKALVDKFGFDVKNASHLIRLLRMSIEFLNTGELIVKRPDANELLEIKRGEWELGKVKEEAGRLFKLAEIAYEKSSLPERPDADMVNKICVEVVSSALHLNWRSKQ